MRIDKRMIILFILIIIILASVFYYIFNNRRNDYYQTTGQANWNKYNSTYSALVRPGYTGGFVGTFYTIEFIWDLGGGHYGYDTLERTNGFGALPS